MGLMPVMTYESASDPTVNEDGTKAYRQGVMWRNTSSGEVFFCAAAAPGAASWLPLGTVLSAAELAFIDSVTAGTAAAGKAMVLDSNSELNDVGVLKVSDTNVTTAQVLALNATPITVVAAPGAGVYLEFVKAYVLYDYNSAAYAGVAAGEDLVFKYTNAAGVACSQQLETTGFLDLTADALAIVDADGADLSGVQVAVANAAIVIHLLSGEVITGDSPLKIRVLYREVRTAALEAIA